MGSCLLLARHGETEWNREGRMQGRENSPLTERGHTHAHDLAALARMLGVRRVLASPLERARVTAEIVADSTGCDVELRGELQEVDFGLCAGLTLAGSYRIFPGLEQARQRNRWGCPWPGGESYADVCSRLGPLLSGLDPCARGEGPTLIVAHQSVNRVLLHCLTGLPTDRVLAGEQPSRCVLRIEPDRRVSHTHVPESAHLAPESGFPLPILWEPGLYERQAAFIPSR